MRLASVPGWPNVNALSHARPRLSLEIFAGVYAPNMYVVCSHTFCCLGGVVLTVLGGCCNRRLTQTTIQSFTYCVITNVAAVPRDSAARMFFFFFLMFVGGYVCFLSSCCCFH